MTKVVLVPFEVKIGMLRRPRRPMVTHFEASTIRKSHSIDEWAPKSCIWYTRAFAPLRIMSIFWVIPTHVKYELLDSWECFAFQSSDGSRIAPTVGEEEGYF